MRTLVLLALALGSLLGALMIHRQGSKAAAALDWPQVTGSVLDSRVETRAARGSAARQWDYKAVIHYRYTLNGRQYDASRRRYPEPGYSDNEAGEAAIAARYPAGQPVRVHVNPANPADSVLEAGRHWTVWAGMAMAILVAVIAIAVLVAG